MSRLPSAETQLRHARGDLHRTKQELSSLKEVAESYRIRATKAEQEVSEWKRRFDALLKILPEKV